MKPIRILSPELNLQGEVDNYLSFSFARKYHSSGEFQLVTSNKVQNADKLQINNLIMLGADKLKTGIIRHREIKTEDNGEEILTVRGYTLNAILKQRITIPPENQAQDIIETDAETAMKHYVQRNCLDITGMEFPLLAIAEDKKRGPNIRWQSRYKNLAEELESISKVTGLGWHIYLDLNLKKWIFNVYSGRNLTANQSTLPPVIFSPSFDNVRAQEYIDSLIGFGNYAIVAGQGEGANREIVTVGSDESGLNKHAVFIDARDIENSSDLKERGENRLAEYERFTSFQSEVLPSGPFKYQEDWDLGDVVTVQNKDWNIIMNTRITEVTEIYEAAGFRLNVTFGSSVPTLTEKLKTVLGELKIESMK